MQGPRILRTIPRNWNTEHRHDGIHLAKQLQEDLQEAIQAIESFLTNVRAPAPAQVPFRYVLEEIDRVTHAVASAAYCTVYRKVAQALTPNCHNWPRK